jgi:2',3'-cyclic-nucleotide 2'-phosphodiesterase (5'-nucleotidase family)
MIALRRLAALCLGLALLLSVAAHAETTKVTFILTNDIYSMGDSLMSDGKRRGGFARLAAVVKAERDRARASGGHVVFAHGGDTLSPSLMSSVDRGAHIIALTNLIPPDIFVPGNHEFDFGKAIFLQRMAEAKFPPYAANLRGPDGLPLPGFKDRTILTLDGVRIGLTGATHDRSPRMSSTEDLKVLPTIETMKREAEALRRDGADFVVAVMHADRQQGFDLAATHIVDLILTGHNHDLFVNYDGRSAMVESSFDAHYVALIDVTIEVKVRDGKRETAWWPQFRIIDTATVAPDPEVAALVAGLEERLAREMNVPLATLAVEFDSRNSMVRTRETAIGNVIADAMRDKTGAVAAITNGGGIRAGRIYAPGSSITRRDVLAELPFGNRLMTLDLLGRDLKAALENGLSGLPNPAGRFPQVSGLVIEFDPKQPAGSRIRSVRIAGEPLDLDRIYRVATNDFMARGQDGYATLPNGTELVPADDAPLLAHEVMEYLRKLGTVRTGVEGRLVVQ